MNNQAIDAQIDPGFAIYIHWPFCAAKCPYCDFNSHVARQIDQAAWCKAYLDEIDRWAARLPDRQPLTSVFFGGGTPSLMPVETVAAILTRIDSHWPLDAAEVTLEANPTSVDAMRFSGYHSGGVNRVSMGFQALNDADLRALGRQHSVAESLAALDTARHTFSRVSFDLIYARQNQSLAAWAEELDRALALGPDHISLYQLTIEVGTRFGEMYARGGLRGLPDDDLAHDMYTHTSERLMRTGFSHYEVSNFARPGQESRHNLVYWRYGDYVGIGPGAHGRINRPDGGLETIALSNPDRWLTAVASGSTTAETLLSRREQGEEFLLMALRLDEGISRARLARYPAIILSEALDELTSSGHIWQTTDRFGATGKGRLVLNHIIHKLIAG